MKRLIPLLLLFTTLCAKAQTANSTTFSAGLELGIPSMGVYSIGLGISAKGEFPVAGPIALTVTAGYSTFFYKSNLFQSSLTPTAAGFIPLKAGVKYYFGQGVYAEGELGTAIETNYLKQDLFAFSLGPGFTIPTNGGHSIDLGVRYESWSDHSVRQTAIRVAYRLGR